MMIKVKAVKIYYIKDGEDLWVTLSLFPVGE